MTRKLPDRFACAAAIEVICHQANLALERLRVAQAAEDARTAATREQLRAALLTSLSHDLRTPLATILGAITRDDTSLHLTPTEFDLLVMLARNPGRVLSHCQI